MGDQLHYLFGKFKEGLNAFMSALAEGFLHIMEVRYCGGEGAGEG